VLHGRMTRKPALRVILLLGRIRREGVGFGIIVKLGKTPSTTVGEPFAVFYHAPDAGDRTEKPIEAIDSS
jgi:hypothetical protein